MSPSLPKTDHTAGEAAGPVAYGDALPEDKNDEECASGAVALSVYSFYVSAVGWGLAAAVLASLVAMQVSVWLKALSVLLCFALSP